VELARLQFPETSAVGCSCLRASLHRNRKFSPGRGLACCLLPSSKSQKSRTKFLSCAILSIEGCEDSPPWCEMRSVCPNREKKGGLGPEGCYVTRTGKKAR